MNTVRTSSDDETTTITVVGTFNYDLLPQFRDAYLKADPTCNFVVDLRHAENIDSSALGILLNMQRHLKKGDGEILIINASETIKHVLHVTRFTRKFRIE